MPSFPDWTPTALVQFYDRLERKDSIDGLHVPGVETLDSYYESDKFRDGFALLRYAMESPIMEKAWKAIDKRSDDTSLENLARVLLEISNNLLAFDSISDATYRNNYAALKELSNYVDKALTKYKDTLGIENFSETENFGEGLDREAANLRYLVGIFVETESDFDRFVGKRLAINAKRTYLVNQFAEIFDAMFGAPLYSSIGSLVAVILDDDEMDTDHIRKLVQYHRMRLVKAGVA